MDVPIQVKSETSSPDGDNKGKSSRRAVRESHVGLYLITRCVAVWITLTMILTFFAESFLNTVRMNKGIAENGSLWIKNNPILAQIHKFYPDGNSYVTLITSDLVYVYIFVVGVFTLMRFTYHKALRDDAIEPFVGGLSWGMLKSQNQSFLVRMCWLLSPNAGVHKKFFIFWLAYVFIFAISFSIAGLFGVRVYLSPELKNVLFGGGITVAFGLLEDLKFFQKIPPREALMASLLAMVEGGFKRDVSGTIKRISAIMDEANGPGSEEVIDVLQDLIKVLIEKEKAKLLFTGDRG